MKRTGLVYHEDYLLHHAGSWHPEGPERLQSIMNHLAETKLLAKLNLVQPYPADIDWIATIHNRNYISSVEQICSTHGFSNLDADTYVCPDSYRIALLAAGGALAAADAMMEGRIDNAFCLLRPPGHHAEKTRAMGFCLFNNIAILAKYLQLKFHLEKIFILDWDVHHGNGTQNSFYDDPTVFYFSIHQYPHYPGTGLPTERGIGKGEGYTLNIPLAGGHGNEDYMKIFQDQLVPVVKDFQPDCILISAGFDGHWNDPLAGMQLTESGYAKLTEIILEVAEECCRGRAISLLEGGYNLEMLAKSVAAHIKMLLRGGE